MEIHSEEKFIVWTPQTLLHPAPLLPASFQITSESGMEKTAEEEAVPIGSFWRKKEKTGFEQKSRHRKSGQSLLKFP